MKVMQVLYKTLGCNIQLYLGDMKKIDGGQFSMQIIGEDGFKMLYFYRYINFGKFVVFLEFQFFVFEKCYLI